MLGFPVNDGSVVWNVKNFISSFPNIYTDTGFAYPSGIANIDTVNLSGTKMITYQKTNKSTENKPESESYGGILSIYNTQAYTAVEKWTNSTTGNEFIRSRFAGGENIGKWNAWKQQEQIVAKSIYIQGYIKYVSGLIIQWGVNEAETNSFTITYPITFINDGILVGGTSNKTDIIYRGSQHRNEVNLSTTNVSASSILWYQWIAIGY